MPLPFLNPWLLLGTLAVAVPVVAHLLNRHRFKTIEWGAMELLRRVVRLKSRQLRLEDILLMLLRCAVILLVALALARPTTSWLGHVRDSNVGVVVGLDGSLSMTHRPGVRSRFEQAVDQVREIFRTVPPGRPVSLVLLGSRPRVLLRGVANDVDRVERILDGLKPLCEELNLERCLSKLEPLVREIKAPEHEVYLVTDGQAITWGEPSDRTRRLLQDLGSTARLYVVAGEAAGEENLAVTGFELETGVLRKGAMVRYTADVCNFGRRPSQGGQLSLSSDGVVVDRRLVGQLAPGETASVSLHAPLTRDGLVRLTARLEPDALRSDDARHAVAQVRRVLRVLCVDGSPSDRPFGGATDFLSAALWPDGGAEADTSVSVTTVSWLLFPTMRLSEFDVVLLANVPEIPAPKVAAIADFVERGGGLVLFMGENVEPDVLQTRLRNGRASLLPARLLGGNGRSYQLASAAPIDMAMPDHPVVRPLKSLPPSLVGESRIRRVVDARPARGGRVLLKLAGGGQPLLLEKQFGRGRVLLVTTSADTSWSDLPLSPVYPLLIQQAVTHLVRQPHERPVTVPEPVSLPLVGRERGTPVEFQSPDGESVTTLLAMRDGRILAELPETSQPGIHQIKIADEPAELAVAVNLPVRESDAKTLSADELEAGLADSPVRLLSGEHAVATAARRTRVGWELWPGLLSSALGLMIVESLWATWASRNGR